MKERSLKREADSEDESETEEMEEIVEGTRKRIMIRVVVCGGQTSQRATSSSSLCCQADECSLNLSFAKRYHRRHKVCERHFKAPIVLVAGIRQRFCQQCSRFHEISQFDDTKRSCRMRLVGHNERRRKTQSDLQGEDEQEPPEPKVNSNLLRTKSHPKYEITLQGDHNTKHFPIR